MRYILSGMPEIKKRKGRLTRADWLDAAMEVLVRDGINSVTVDALAGTLGVTRGSFYHHFKNREDLSQDMLDYWSQKWTVDIREDVAALQMDGYQSLRALGHLIHHRGGSLYDVAVRAWAHHDPIAMETVQEVDTIRLEFITSQFRKIGFSGIDLENRSRLFLYYSMSEPAFTLPQDEKRTALLAGARLDLLTAKESA